MSRDVDDSGMSSGARGPLVAGAVIGGGRYRLLTSHGGHDGLLFWQARDTRLDRDVALTIVPAEPDAKISVAEQNAILTRTQRLARISAPGIASVLDVVRSGPLGIVISEWTPGESLRTTADAGADPVAAAHAVSVLARAAEAAHAEQAGLALVHPDQIRISNDGKAVLGFPGSSRNVNVESDVKGLGAVLYALLTGRWALGKPESPVGGLAPAIRGENGLPVDPAKIHPDVPFDIAEVATRALNADQGVSTAETVAQLLEQASYGSADTDFVPPVRIGQKEVDPSPEQNKKTWMTLAGLGAATVVLLALVFNWMFGALAGGGGSDGSLSGQIFGLSSASAKSSAAKPTEVRGIPMVATDAAAWCPGCDADNPGDAGLAIDNDNDTKWQTDGYAKNFPVLKSGVGLILTLPKAASLLTAWVATDTPGTVVEIRTARSSNPDKLTDTTKVGTATLKNGVNDIKLDPTGDVRYVIVWITSLAKPLNQSSIAEVGFTSPAA